MWSTRDHRRARSREHRWRWNGTDVGYWYLSKQMQNMIKFFIWLKVNSKLTGGSGNSDSMPLLPHPPIPGPDMPFDMYPPLRCCCNWACESKKIRKISTRNLKSLPEVERCCDDNGRATFDCCSYCYCSAALDSRGFSFDFLDLVLNEGKIWSNL